MGSKTKISMRKTKSWGGWLLLLPLLACNTTNNSRVATLPYYNEPSFTPHWYRPGDKALQNLHQISPFQLRNQLGQQVSRASFENKIHVANFFFTLCPGICTNMMANMAQVQDQFLDDPEVLLLSFSVTPTKDSVPVLRAYAQEKGIVAHKWHLATGNRDLIYSLGRNDYFVEQDPDAQKKKNAFIHSENLVLIDKQNHIRGIYNGLSKTAIDQLIADIYTLKKER